MPSSTAGTKNSSIADDRWVAYALATAYHETAFTMQPINEYGGDAYFFKMYDKDGDRPEVAARLGNTDPGDGVLFHGRGYVQLTGRANYTRMQQLLEIDLTSNASCADRALNPDTASRIMEIGMRDGIFTGKKFRRLFQCADDGLDQCPAHHQRSRQGRGDRRLWAQLHGCDQAHTRDGEHVRRRSQPPRALRLAPVKERITSQDLTRAPCW